ncbi:MAG: hypothetical protein A2X12_10590 [Bacteroidetes bacterium GWE2_29_8]|nr:MAG: hypothetical protein A2X12_10590 [Bacteroidetes bacterium GWE2_29_8]OFY23200.1 MAG: hypothetical protein A2X02_09380 [Bacteroidetes bacterium GWF2_29_10]
MENNIEEKEAISLFKNSYTFGAYTGLGLLIVHYILYISGALLESSFMGIFIYIVLIVGMSYGTTVYRNKALNGFINYSKSLKSCTMIGFFASLFIGLFYFLVFYFDASFIDKQIDAAYKQLSQISFIKENDMELAIEKIKEQTPFGAFMSNFISFTLISTFLGLLISIFVKKKDNSFESNFKETE